MIHKVYMHILVTHLKKKLSSKWLYVLYFSNNLVCKKCFVKINKNNVAIKHVLKENLLPHFQMIIYYPKSSNLQKLSKRFAVNETH